MQDFLEGRSFVLRPWWQRWWTFALLGILFVPFVALMLRLAPQPFPHDCDLDIDGAQLAKLQGTWEVTALEKDGVDMPLEEEGKKHVLTVRGRFYTWASGGSGEITRLAPGEDPPEVDYVGFRRDGDVPELGIYEFIGDDIFRDCGSTNGRRPAAFLTWKGSGYTLTTYRRVR